MYLPGGVPAGGVYLLGVYLPWGGVLAQGDVPAPEGTCQGGVPGPGGGTCPGSPPCGQNDRHVLKHNLRKLCLRAVIEEKKSNLCLMSIEEMSDYFYFQSCFTHFSPFMKQCSSQCTTSPSRHYPYFCMVCLRDTFQILT